MKSKQLNFFITPEDYNEIDHFIKEKSALVLVKQYIDKRNNGIQKELPNLDEEIFQVYLTKEVFLKDIEILSADNGIKYFENWLSPILQFSLGGFYPYDKNLLQRGRFYYVTGAYNSKGDFVYKTTDFVQWSDSIIKDFKRLFLKKYSKGDGFWYSESAIQWIEEHDAVLINGGQEWQAKI
ncbi:hypothetical protein FAZ15_16340 [Sphingobacterium olei]|uniref:Uncharacterized protein n=1 Tax=Sphingobacterium olei TaxID=2571155 RepID=A0A4U0NIU7_9SPHI|nr:hypothetical protein [Sphingobacterium olei]TJZ53602.1 hypothetical protein FAZ15_16340 [Sphingobacterium olei]